jgi:hypothetical protein
VRGLIVDVVLPDGATLASGKAHDDYGQLEGRAYKHSGVSFWPEHNITDDRVKIEWVVQGRAGQAVELVAQHEKAGTLRTTVTLK